MLSTRLLALAACVACGTASAASPTELEAVFAKAQKKGASAVYRDRCDAHGTASGGIWFDDNTPAALAKVVGVLAAAAVIKDSGGDSCSAGLQPGEERLYEIYPDGTVKTN